MPKRKKESKFDGSSHRAKLKLKEENLQRAARQKEEENRKRTKRELEKIRKERSKDLLSMNVSLLNSTGSEVAPDVLSKVLKRKRREYEKKEEVVEEEVPEWMRDAWADIDKAAKKKKK